MEEEKKEKREKPQVRIDVNKHGIRRETYIGPDKPKPRKRDKGE